MNSAHAWALTQDYHFAKAPMVAAVIISLFSVAVCSCAIFLSSLDWDLSHGTLEANLSVEWLALI